MNNDTNLGFLKEQILLLLYATCDQYGNVDKSQFILEAPFSDTFSIPDKINQEHLGVLTTNGALPDISSILERMKKPRRGRPRKLRKV
mgnify:CR=1 FL=1